MLERNSQGHILCPPLVAGVTQEDLLAWYGDIVGEQFGTLVEQYGAAAMTELAVMAYSQARYLTLFSEAVSPETEDEQALVQAVLAGAPFSLTPVGLEAEDESAGLHPWLARDEQGWRWYLNDIRSKPFAGPEQALRSYEAYTRTVLSVV